MSKNYSADVRWSDALTLRERIALFPLAQTQPPKTSSSVASAERHIEKWRAQHPFTKESHFSDWLDSNDLDSERFLEVLSTSSELLQDCLPEEPEWIAELKRAYFNGTLAQETLPNVENEAGFLIMLGPLIERGLERVRSGIPTLCETHADAPIDTNNIEGMLVQSLLGSLMWKLTRTMVLELHVARIEGLLAGDTPEERYQSFLNLLRQPEFAISILREYPVLARQLEISTDHWVRFSLEFLNHLCIDWKLVQERLAPDQDHGVLVEIKAGAGDTHRQGRSVIIAKFASGFQVVYKPHSLSVDVHFIELLGWLNDRGEHAQFRTVKVIDRETYGWVEFVEASPCLSAEEIERFYERQGGFLALLYVLEATDFHFENLIASGEHPVLVDLEALFHPRQGSPSHDSVSALTHQAMQHSVLRIGLLPQRIWLNNEYDGFDSSGLGGAAGQLTPFRILRPQLEGTDQMHMVRTRIEMPGSNNLPSLNGENASVLNHRAEIVKGFTSIYLLLLEHRDELMEEDGLLARFANDDVRAVLRHTRSYAVLLGESFHPEVLQDALTRDRLFDSLWVGIDQRPYMSRVIPAEQADLQRGDIPLFKSRPGSRHLWTSTDELIPDFFEQSSIDLVKDRLRALSESDLQRQVWFIGASMTALADVRGHNQLTGYQVQPSQTSVDREKLISLARSVANRLTTMAVRDEDTAVWIGLALAYERVWTPHPIGIDFYDGTPGIALFLAYLSAITGETRYKELSRAALETVKRQLAVAVEHPKRLGGIGGFSGWGGIIYTLTHLSRLWNDSHMLAEAESYVELLPDLIAQDEQLDVMSGSAGCIAALLGLYQATSSKRVLEVASLCADRLVATAQPMDHGIGWTTTIESTQPLTGFSHGTGGIAWALLKIAALTGNPRYREAALAALAYEHSLLDREEGNWPDFRTLGKPVDATVKTFMLAWCHGAPGIGLGRLESLNLEDNAAIREDIHAALRITMNRGFGFNQCLCHGDLGNLELLVQARDKFGDTEVVDFIKLTTAAIVEGIETCGWLCGVPMGVEIPGLMMGLAGIGYGLLRLAEPARVPSVLTLAPPPMRL